MLLTIFPPPDANLEQIMYSYYVCFMIHLW